MFLLLSETQLTSISRLRDLREKSKARRRDSSSRSRSSTASSLTSSKDDGDSDFVDGASKSHLTSILVEGLGSTAVSPARVVAPCQVDPNEPSPDSSVDGSSSTDGERPDVDLASISEGGISRSVSPACTATSKLYEASQELDQQLRALREGEERAQRGRVPDRAAVQLARCLPDLTATLAFEPPTAMLPDSEVEIRPRVIMGF